MGDNALNVTSHDLDSLTRKLDGDGNGSVIIDLGAYEYLTVLPIKLGSFTGSCSSGLATINWSTLSEINNDYFTLEKSKDAINFIAVAEILGEGNSKVLRNYSFTDDNNSGYPYYRLKQTDFNGQVEYFNIIAIENCESNEENILIYPNPASSQLNIVLDNGSQTWEIINALGQKVSPSFTMLSEKHIKVNLNTLSQGIYYIKVIHLNTTVTVKKIVKK